MKFPVLWLLAFPLLLVLPAGSSGAEPAMANTYSTGTTISSGTLQLGNGAIAGSGTAATLHLANGDYLAGGLLGSAGAVSSGSEGILRWQGSAFVAPLDFPLSAVSAVSFPARGPRPHADGPYCLELEGGDALFGALVGLSSQEVQLDAPGLGLLHVQRSAVQRIWHRRGDADQIYLGPNGLLEWKASPSGAWEQDAGRIFTTRDGASLVGELGIPAQACLDFELSWTSEPDFTWIMGTRADSPPDASAFRGAGGGGAGGGGAGRGGGGGAASADSPSDDPAFRLEVWGHQLMMLRETAQKADLVPLQKITPGAGRCHFRIYLDQEHNRAIVFGADGGQLADLTIADASPPNSAANSHSGPHPGALIATIAGRLAHADSADARPHSGQCLRLINHHGNVRLEQLSIARWNGQPPHAVQGGKSRLLRSDGSIVNGEIEKLDAATKEFIIAAAVDSGSNNTPAVKTARVPADAVESIMLPSKGMRVACSLRAICENGVRLSGDLRKVENGRLWLSRPGILEPLGIALSSLRSLVVLENRKPFAEPPDAASGRLESEGLKLQGSLVESRSSSANCLVWRPRGSSMTSPLKPDFSGRIVYRDTSPRQGSPAPQQFGQAGVAMAAPAGRVVVNGGVLGAVVNIFGSDQPRPTSSSGPWKGPAMYLRTGDTIACEVKRIDERGITFHSPQFDATFVPNEKVRAVELENRSRATKIDLSKRDRLLTLPRMQKEDPPTHLIRSIDGDYLRGRLIEMDDKTLTVEVRLETRHVPRDHVASIIWLEKSGKPASSKEKAANDKPESEKPAAHDVRPAPADNPREKEDQRLVGEKPATSPKPSRATRPLVPATAETRRTNGVQALRSDGVRLTFRPEKLTGTTLQGTSDVLGVCRVELNDVDKLLIGQAIEQEAQALPYQRWNLQPAIEPKFAQADAKNGGTPGIESELVGKLAPDFELDTLDGPRFRLSDQRKKIVVLDFWATWCGPCMQSLPQLVPTVAKFRDRNVVLLAVNLQETPEAIKPVLERLQLKTNVGLDHNGVVAEKYAAVAIPQTVIIDAEGKIARLFVGGGPQYVEQLSAALEAVLAPAAVTPAIGQGKAP